MHGRLIQLIALVVMITCATICGRILTPILDRVDHAGLRYTDVSVEGAPPFVVLGTAMGALRGLIVDYLWIKVHIMQEKGLFYEVMADADLITKLQPRFAAVWAFHGHNMAYNISVATHTREERWQWVNAGIRLVRNEGLRHNPNDLVLYKELAFWFAHKIEGVSDDAHLYYKRQFAREWHYVLGEPPVDQDDRIAWIKELSEAPRTLAEAEQRTPGVNALVERINTEAFSVFGGERTFEASQEFLFTYGQWLSMSQQSESANMLGLAEEYRAKNPFINAFDAIVSDPSVQDAWKTLILHVRYRVLRDEYNMDPEIMLRFTEELGPIDWRHGQAHALYWARLGSELGEVRQANVDDIYKVLNNDRVQLQAMQDLARYGRITFDPFSNEIPSRFPDPRWVDVIEGQFKVFYAKHYGTRGGGGESFIAFLRNFMSSAIREAYRSGETERAEELLASLASKFAYHTDGTVMDHTFLEPLDVFVRSEIEGEYNAQPHLAPSEAIASLRYGFRIGIGRDRPEVWEGANQFVGSVINYFRNNEMYDFNTKFGEGRMRDLLANLSTTKQQAFLQLMTDPSVQFDEKATIWAKVDKFEPMLRVQVYDFMLPSLKQQFDRTALSKNFTLEELFPAPPGLDAFRQALAEERARQERANPNRPDISRTD